MTTTTGKTTAGKPRTGKSPTGKSRTRKTNAAPVEPVKFPASVLAYLQIAVEGPLGPGGIAHRVKRYPVTTVDTDGYRHTDELYSGACLPTTTRPVPGHQPDDDEPAEEAVPVTVCRSHSAAFAQACGVTRCTQPACWPLTADETTTAGHR